MSSSPVTAVSIKKPGPQPIKATHPFSLALEPNFSPPSSTISLTPTDTTIHLPISSAPTTIRPARSKLSGLARKHSAERLSPTDHFNRRKYKAIHRTGSLGSLDHGSISYFASPRIFPPSPVLSLKDTSSITFQKKFKTLTNSSEMTSSTPEIVSCISQISAPTEKTKYIRYTHKRSNSLDSMQENNKFEIAKNYYSNTSPLILCKHSAPLKHFLDSRRVSIEGVDLEVTNALNGLCIMDEPESCPDGHVAPAPFIHREVQSAGSERIHITCQVVSPYNTSPRDSPTSCSSSIHSSSPDHKGSISRRACSNSSPKCFFYRDPPREALSVTEKRVTAITASIIQPPDPLKVGIMLNSALTSKNFGLSAFKPISNYTDSNPISQTQLPLNQS